MWRLSSGSDKPQKATAANKVGGRQLPTNKVGAP